MLDYINTTDTHSKICPLLVMGLGNPLMADDGAGLELLRLVMERVKESDVKSALPLEGVEFEDGGTLGMTLLPSIEDAHAVIFLDAVRTGAEPGTVIVRKKEELPGYFSHVISPHQIGLREVLGAAQFRGTLPEAMYLIGIESKDIEFVRPMSEVVMNAMPEAVETVMKYMALCLKEVRQNA